jgi:hypothetical protein
MWTVTAYGDDGSIVESHTFAVRSTAQSRSRKWQAEGYAVKVIPEGGNRASRPKKKKNTVPDALAAGDGRYSFGSSLFLTIRGGSAR